MGKKYIEIGKRLKILRGNKTQSAFATDIGTTLRAYQYYESGAREPDSYLLKNISTKYGKSIDWLLKGENKTKEEKQSNEIVQGMYQSEFRVSEALTMCARVLESGTSYATALYLNIQHFDRAVTAESRIEVLEKNQIDIKNENRDFEKSIREEIQVLKSQFQNLQSENNELRMENKKLRDLNGGCAPINLSPDNAALTGTDNKKT